MAKNCGCRKMNEVVNNFNLIEDGRAFTDYRSASETYNDIKGRSDSVCMSNNSYETRICLQRNAGVLFHEDKINFASTYNLPKCEMNTNLNMNENTIVNTAQNTINNLDIINLNKVNNVNVANNSLNMVVNNTNNAVRNN